MNAPITGPVGRQDWETPEELIDAVESRFGTIGFDLAASNGQQRANHYYSPLDDSLSRSWGTVAIGNKTAWLNPPFANIAPWAEKLTTECRDLQRWTLMLVPAAVGSNWYREHVEGKALVLFLNPRITFRGATAPYPKDCMLVCCGFGVAGSMTWRWKP